MKLLYNGRIYTQFPSQPWASALLIEGERVLAVGETETLLAQVAARTEKIDLQGNFVLPGLTDAHLHLKHYALSLQKVDCETATLEECLQRLAVRAHTLRPGEWLLGHGWNQNAWATWPSAADLDRIVPDTPVYLTAKSLHAAWVNSAALRLAEITSSTPDPHNGQIQRDAHGNPTGILLEAAMSLVSERIPEPAPDAIATAIEQAQTALWQMGLTSVHDFDRRDSFLALQQLHQAGRLKLRVVKNIPLELLPHAVELGLRSGFGDDWLRIGSVKAFMDGALGPRTAAMFQPYLNEPENRGILNMDAEELFEHGRQAAQVGLSMAVHAIGDRANHEVLNAFEHLRRYEKEHGLPPLRHRIEHVQVLHPNDAARLAQLNVIASMQPIHATSDMEMADRYWGERCALAYAWRTQLENGATLAFGSDAPVESPNPFWGLHAAVTRRRAAGAPGPQGWYPAQRLSLEEALRAYTLGAAYAAQLEERLGRLAPGFLADLIVLEQNPFTVPPETFLTMRPLATMIGGEWVWRRLPS